MPSTMHRQTFLPTIKCSDCGDQIEIASMAEHICVPLEAEPTGRKALPPMADNAPPYPRERFLKPGRPTPRIDPAAANRPYMRTDQPTPQSDYSASPGGPRSYSPISPSAQRRSPRPMYGDMARNNPYGPPSPELTSNLDCAFPPFPTSRSQRRRSPEHSGNQHLSPMRRPSAAVDMAPLSPRLNGGMSVMKRIDTIAPGPFGSRAGGEEAALSSTESNFGHRRNGSSQNSLTRSSTTKSTASRASHGSRQHELMQTRPSLSRSASNDVPSSTSDRWPQPPAKSRTFPLEQSQVQKPSPMTPQRRPSQLSNASLPFRPPMPEAYDDPAIHGSRPSTAPNGVRRRPSEVGSTRSRSTSRSGIRMNTRLDNVPPVPAARDAYDRLNHSHSASDSASSDGLSSASDLRSQSSRSSPSSSAQDGWSRRPSKDERYNPYSESSLNELDPALQVDVPRPLNIAPPLKDIPPPKREAPLDPAIQPGLITRPDPTRFGSQIQNSPPSTSGLEPSIGQGGVKRRVTTTSKGDCRGCGKPIFGKCVKAADGRLTGRYHRECFTCRTCTQPFTDGSFYVLEDQPYCGFHYHKLNHSLCVSCNTGIEGVFLSTDDGRKFHPRCFTCTRCHVVLRDDYYEVAGRPYCEPHAFAAVNRGVRPGGGFSAGPSSLGPGVRAQRRTTRLMMI